MNWVVWTLVAAYVVSVRGCSSKRAIYLPKISRNEDRSLPTGGWNILETNLTTLYPNLVEPDGRKEFLVKQGFTVFGMQAKPSELKSKDHDSFNESSVIVTKFGAVYDRLWYRKWRTFRDGL